MRRSSRAGVWFGDRCGRLERSRKPSRPSSWNRRHHLCAHCWEMFIDSAADATVQPSAIRKQSRSRPSGVKGALACTRPSWVVVLPLNSSTLTREARSPVDVNNVPGNNSQAPIGQRTAPLVNLRRETYICESPRPKARHRHSSFREGAGAKEARLDRHTRALRQR